MDELQVYCLQKKRGCTWIGTLGELNKHLTSEVEGCKYTCVNPSGKPQVGQRDHSEETLKAEGKDQVSYFCEFCDFSSINEDAVIQHYSTCPKFRIPCPYSCGKKVKRCKLDDHLHTCPNVVVPCVFGEMGCKENMKRSEIQQHIEDNVIYHQLMMSEAFKQIKKENEMLKRDNCELRRDVQVLKSTQNTADYWINGYKMMAEEVKKTHWREYLFSLAETSTNIPEPISPVIFKWSSYEASLQKAKKRQHTCYYFRPFYTTKGGYKMQLQLYPNGIGHGKGTHISLHCCIMTGENDDDLNWPFKGTVEVTVLNQVANDQHYKKEIWESDTKKPTEVDGQPDYSEIRNESSWGPTQFMSLAEIEHFTDYKQYLMSDTVYLQVTASTQ